jgi:hypothetical protein
MKIVGRHLVGTICLVGNGVSIVSLVHNLGGRNKVVRVCALCPTAL